MLLKQVRLQNTKPYLTLKEQKSYRNKITPLLNQSSLGISSVIQKYIYLLENYQVSHDFLYGNLIPLWNLITTIETDLNASKPDITSSSSYDKGLKDLDLLLLKNVPSDFEDLLFKSFQTVNAWFTNTLYLTETKKQ